MDEAAEKAFLQRLVRMDEKAWERFCKEYGPPLRQFVRLYAGCGVEKAEEIVQMVFVRCVRSIRTFDPSRGRLFQWLKAISKNEAHTVLRQDNNRDRRMAVSAALDPAAGKALHDVDRAPLPDEILARTDVQSLIQEILLGMRSSYRDVLTMKYLDGLRVTEIAVRLALSEKAVESLLTRAREAFRTALAKNAGSDELEEGIVAK